ncbi:GRAS family transcription factor family protein [Actinidia rufa]|uniref:DELLA protein n=1 Tax=Actinidia rufa TaxID=165716 RepID=A0A7J0FHY8_9ERIC|nr:GRAS family transcription factor family protein [Actinidia rufa]
MGPYESAMSSSGSSSSCAGKAPDQIDGLLAGAGYRVRSSELRNVAQRLERLETVMVNTPSEISHLANDAVLHNPSDLASWVDSLLSELNQSVPIPDFSDLTYAESLDPTVNTGAWMEHHAAEPNREIPQVLTAVEEDSSIRLVHVLMTCAGSVQRGEFLIGRGASPYLKFAHFTANQAILEAFDGHDCVHVIDFNLMQGLQWPALIQALALRPGGPPLLRLTGMGPPSSDGRDSLREIGLRLAELAHSVNVQFAFRGVAASRLEDVKLSHGYKALAEIYIQREICNVVCCEGLARVERHESLAKWRARLSGAGFKPLHLGSNAFKQASMLLTLFSAEGYCVEENEGCLTLGWHSRPLIAVSAWQAIPQPTPPLGLVNPYNNVV